MSRELSPEEIKALGLPEPEVLESSMPLGARVLGASEISGLPKISTNKRDDGKSEPSNLGLAVGPLRKPIENILDGVSDVLGATVEIGAAMADGMLASAAGGIHGSMELLAGMVAGDPDAVDKAVDALESTQQAVMDATPGGNVKSELGKKGMENIAKPFLWLENEVIKPVGDEIVETTGSPAAATAWHTAASSAPLPLMRFRGGVRPFQENFDRAAAKKAESMSAKHDVHLDSRPEDIADQIAVSAHKQAGIDRGDSLEGVQNALRTAEQKRRDSLRLAAEDIKSRKAAVHRSAIQDMRNDVRQTIKDGEWIEEGFPSDLKKVLRDLDDLAAKSKAKQQEVFALPTRTGRAESATRGAPGAQTRTRTINEPKPDYEDLSEVFKLYKQLNQAHIPADNRPALAVASIVRGTIKSRLDTQFHKDMIKGDAAAIDAWKRYNKRYSNYIKDFRESKVVKDMIELEASPETMRAWVFGAAESLSAHKASSVVKHLNKLLGKDSAEMTMLRNDAKLNLLAPLLDESGPNVKAFVNKVKNLEGKNKSLANELFQDQELKELAQIAKAFQKHQWDGWAKMADSDAIRIIGRFAFGHGLAKAQARQNIFTNIMRFVVGSPGHRQRMDILSELSGLDHSAPMFGQRTMQQLGIMETASDWQEQPEQPSP